MEEKEFNIYDAFIEYLKSIEMMGLDSKESIEKHHILPKHAGGTSAGETVLCSAKNHTLAHFYRFLVYRQIGDWVCYCMRKNQKTTGQERIQLSIEKKKKQLCIGCWDPEWQRKQGKKGGQIGGSKKSLKQFAARSKVGLCFGSQNGKKNQSIFLKKILSKKTTWLYKKENFSFFITLPS